MCVCVCVVCDIHTVVYVHMFLEGAVGDATKGISHSLLLMEVFWKQQMVRNVQL